MGTKNSIGLVEYKTVPVAVQATDAMLKAAQVELVFSAPMCPGKYVVIVSGDVSSVKTSVGVGVEEGGMYCISSQVLTNIHRDVFPAIAGVCEIGDTGALGLLETMSAISAVRAADIAAKAANVRLIECRLARGLGGKSFIALTGEVSSVKTAIRTCEDQMADQGDIVSSAVIAQPHPMLRDSLLR